MSSLRLAVNIETGDKMAIDKKMLAAGGVITVATALTLTQIDEQPVITKLTPAQEIILALPGQEIESMRTETSQTYKLKEDKLKTVVFKKPKFYLDTEDSVYKKPDLTVKEISLLASLNPFREHDKYVNAGFYTASWLNADEADYKFRDENDNYVKYNTAYKTKGIAVFKAVTPDGVKQTYVMLSDSTAKALIWQVDSSGKMILQKDNSVLIENSNIIIQAPSAFDNKGDSVFVKVEVVNDTLKYIPDLNNVEYPITIDPTTVIVNDTDAMTGSFGGTNYALYSTAHDSASTGNTTTTAAYWTIGQYGSGGIYQVYRGLMRFDTSAIPDSAIIDTVKFKMVVYNKGYLATGFYNHIVEAQDTVSVSYFAYGMFSRFKSWKSGAVSYDVADLADSVNIPTTISIGDTLTHTFNSQGRLEINKTGTTQFYLMSGRDIGRVTPTGGENVQMEDDSPYLYIIYHLPYGLNSAALTEQATSGTVSHTHPSTYTGARDTTTGAGAYPNFSTDGVNWVGQYKTGSTYVVGRSFVGFDLSGIAAADTVSKVELWVYGYSDSSTTNFDLYAVKSTKSGALSREWFNDFNGWAASGAYSPVYLSDAWNTVRFTNGWNVIPFTTAGKDSVVAHKGDSLQVALLSGRDIASTAPTGNEYITIGGGVYSPFLKVFLTGRVPQSVSVTSISADSLLVSWLDKTGDETGFRIINSDTGAAIDSVLTDVSSKRIGGLSINTLYRLKIQVKGGVLDGQYSAIDSCYTRANIPSKPTVTFPVDSLAVIKINTNSNPAYTEFAILDSLSNKFVQKITGLDTLGASPVWQTYANWGGSAGDTVYIKPGKKYNFQVKARSGQ